MGVIIGRRSIVSWIYTLHVHKKNRLVLKSMSSAVDPVWLTNPLSHSLDVGL